MATLTLLFKDVVQREFALEPGRALTIGREPNNDVVIDNRGVSALHARIEWLPTGFLLSDLASKNGTFVNDKRVGTHWLAPGDAVTIGKHTLRFAASAAEMPEASRRVEVTLPMATEEHRERSAPVAIVAGRTGVLVFLKGGRDEVKLGRPLTRFGSEAACDVVFSGLTVGKTAFTISRGLEGYRLHVVAGMARPRINGEVVKEAADLREHDIIEFADEKMELLFRR